MISEHLNYRNTYLEQQSRSQLISEYISHEITKIDFSTLNEKAEQIRVKCSNEHGVLFKNFLKRVLNEVENKDELIGELSLRDKWLIFHGISFGLMAKELYNCVGHPDFDWKLEKLDPSVLVLETKVGFASKILGSTACFDQVYEHAKNLSKKELEQSIMAYDCRSPLSRSEDSLIGRMQPNGLVLVHDGNGRLVRLCSLLALKDQSKPLGLEIWVGFPKQSNLEDRRIYSRALQDVFRMGSL
jgi:hypothetical protein